MTNTKRAMLVAAVVAGGVLAERVEADVVYRWKDEAGKTNFSNVGPTGESTEKSVQQRPNAVPARRSEASEDGSATEMTGDEGGEGPYAALSRDTLSVTATRKRLELRRQLEGVKDEIASVRSEIRALRQSRRSALQRYGARLQGVGAAPPDVASEQEEDLEEKREALEERAQKIRETYAALEEEAVKREGKRPGWWRPLD